MQIYFAIPPNSAFHGLLEEFFFIYQRYKMFNTLVINSLGKRLTNPDSPYLVISFFVEPDINSSGPNISFTISSPNTCLTVDAETA